ncbi:MAG: NUDIX domain-containing protein, partial [Pseudonocardiaceae bacterium]
MIWHAHRRPAACNDDGAVLMIKHATASVFVFREFPEGWRLGLVEQPRLRRHRIVGGHVELDETQAEAAVREATEESGLQV